MSALMHAAVVKSANGDFIIEALGRPEPAPGELLVRIKASGVNPLDAKVRAGGSGHARHPFPAVFGIDMAGTVVAVGDGVTRFAVGDDVFGMTGGVGGIQGSLADYAAVDARLVAHKPANLSHREAAALPLITITAWEGLVDRAGVAAGQRVLVQGGAGGVGHIAVQLALANGAEVFATGRAAHGETIARLGATPIDFEALEVDDYVARYTGGEGFDLVYDSVGGASLDASFAAVRRFGHVVSAFGWGTHALAPLSFKGATYSGVFTLHPLLTGEGRAHHGEILRAAATLVEEGKLMPILDPRRFTLETVADAHALVANGTARGKVVIDID